MNNIPSQRPVTSVFPTDAVRSLVGSGEPLHALSPEVWSTSNESRRQFAVFRPRGFFVFVFTASPLVHGSTVYAFADDGKTVLFEASDVFEEVGRNQLDGRIQATPAAVDGSLIVRTDAALYRLTDAKGNGKK